MAKDSGTKTMQAWATNANLLAEWCLSTCVNRTDASGAYWIKDGSVCSYTDKKRTVNLERLHQHFTATDCTSLIGLHALGTDNTGRWAAVDIDLHDGDKATPDQTQQYAAECYRRLRRFQPLVTESNGKGGYHVRIFFTQPVQGEILYRFARWMTAGWQHFLPSQPEFFPKQPAIEEGKYGNWLRMIGRHHKRAVYPRVFTPNGMVDEERSINEILTHWGVDPSNIPAESLEDEVSRKSKRSEWIVPRGTGDGKPWEEFDRKANWEELLSQWGWRPSSARNCEITYWTRPGKDSGISGSLGHRSDDGVPLFFCFTSNADPLPPWRYYTPSQAWTHYQFRGDFRLATKALREMGYGRQ